MERFTTCTQVQLMDMLKLYFGYDSFRYPQQQIIESILTHKSCLAIMPTGSGKSLCFQMLSLLARHPIIVISPLISLMDDQVREAQSRGIKAVAIHSATKVNVKDFNHYQLIFCSPERFQSTNFKQRLLACGLSLIVVDEAHCISRWGHEFRPAYQKIKKNLADFSSVNVLALTATASGFVQKDIIKQLGIKRNATIFKSSLQRKNLFISLQKVDDKELYLMNHITQNQTSIVYTRSRSHTESLATFLSKNGIKAKAFHAKLAAKMKQEVQQSWFEGNTPCIVATNAFGMGINKSSVRQVFHYHIPDSIEDYIQEIGRAGRDNKNARCQLLYTTKEVAQLKRSCKHPVSSLWNSYSRYKIGSRVRMLGLITRNICRYRYLLDYFGEEMSHNCGTCDYCLSQNK